MAREAGAALTPAPPLPYAPAMPPRTHGPRVQVTSTRAMVDAATRRGVDRAALLADHGITEAMLADPDARVPAAQVHALWLDAIARTGEPQLPVLAAMELPWGAYRVVDYLCASADTLGDALHLMSRIFAVIHDRVRLRVASTDDGGGSLRVHRPDGGDIPGMYANYTMTACIYRLRTVIGDAVHPARVHFRHPAPTDASAHHEAFGPHLHFDQAHDEAVFAPELWSRPAMAPNPGLRSVLNRHADALLAELPSVDPLVEQIRGVLQSGLPRGHAELSRVAKVLGVSPRTLQRRLVEAGVSWRDLLAETRFTLAKAHLSEDALSVEEVGLLVGYADHSSFHRAFVSWSGVTPGAWRHTH